jgi:hypothetical protein
MIYIIICVLLTVFIVVIFSLLHINKCRDYFDNKYPIKTIPRPGSKF